VDDIRLPAAMRRQVAAYRLARGRAERERRQAEKGARRPPARLSRRDAAELLSVSHHRIQPITAHAPPVVGAFRSSRRQIGATTFLLPEEY
jgi:hypothetical protein